MAAQQQATQGHRAQSPELFSIFIMRISPQSCLVHAMQSTRAHSGVWSTPGCLRECRWNRGSLEQPQRRGSPAVLTLREWRLGSPKAEGHSELRFWLKAKGTQTSGRRRKLKSRHLRSSCRNDAGDCAIARQCTCILCLFFFPLPLLCSFM